MVRWRCRVTGIVQGVGFRPTVYRYAIGLGLAGFVRNDADGVMIEVEGAPEKVRSFVERLRKSPPPLARIDTFEVEETGVKGEKGFEIVASRRHGEKSTAVSPDVTVCDACLAEMRDPSDRRYRYPFINCTDCGPRYTITKTVPYDRPNTSMAVFEMCEACRVEYEDPASRRYHAQPIACRACGPTLELRMVNGEWRIEGD